MEEMMSRLCIRRGRPPEAPPDIILDAAGREATRAAGAPRKETVLATLDGIV